MVQDTQSKGERQTNKQTNKTNEEAPKVKTT